MLMAPLTRRDPGARSSRALRAGRKLKVSIKFAIRAAYPLRHIRHHDWHQQRERPIADATAATSGAIPQSNPFNSVLQTTTVDPADGGRLEFARSKAGVSRIINCPRTLPPCVHPIFGTLASTTERPTQPSH
jgi:hypothetical protein